MHSDPLGDFLTRIRNGSRARLTSVDCPCSKEKVEVAKILEAEGFIVGHEISNETKFPTLKVHLRYDARRKPQINSLKRVSTPGLRVYKKATELKPIRNGLATQILTTNLGYMTDREARRKGVGGEVICEVY